MRKKAQAWSIDLIAGITIFLIAITSYFIFVNNLPKENNLSNIYDEAVIVSDKLLSIGSPENWTYQNIEQPGITDGEYRLNSSKLKNLSAIEYSRLKLLLNTKYDFLIYFQDKDKNTLNISGIKYISKTHSLNKTNIEEIEDTKNMISIRRFLVYNKSIVQMVLYSWD